MKIESKLLAFGATQFENFTYDLVIAAGFRNVVWRTPGADGGRDIEAECFRVDLAGETTIERWYVECKRYETSLSWPVLREKLAFAENHEADYLLISTTSELSPKCRDEVATWNSRRTRPRVRTWTGAQLSNRVRMYPALLSKYDLSNDAAVAQAAVVPLALIGQKAIHAAYGEAFLAGTSTPSLEYAAAIMELVHARLAAPAGIRPASIKATSRHIFEWCVVGTGVDLASFDPHALRALVAGARFVSRASGVEISSGANIDEILLTPKSGSLPNRPLEFVRLVSMWSNLEAVQRSGQVRVTARGTP